MKVLQLATAGPLYGAERWILALASSLDPAKVECQIAVIDDQHGDEPPLHGAARMAGLKSRRIRYRGYVDWAAARALRALLRNERFDVVHSHGYKADLLALLGAWRTPAATLATPHGWSECADWKLRLYEWGDRALFPFFDAVAPLSPALRDGIVANPLAARKVRYIANGVDLEEVDLARSTAGASPAGGSGLNVGYCGQLIARKDVATLLRAFSQVGDASARLTIIGKGPERAALEAETRRLGIEEKVQFLGYRPDRLELVARLDVFVLPSLREGIARCLMEAMALKIPVIATDIPGNRDVVEQGETGMLFPPGDVDALGLLLRSFAARTDGQRQLRVDKARVAIEEAYSAAGMASAYERLFVDLATVRPLALRLD